jgi:outer membrane receptor protein involved in Fe transport
MKVRFLQQLLLLFITTILLQSNTANAQISISGFVKNAEGEAIIGASVALIDKGPIKGGITDFDGRFLLVDIPSGRYTLAVSYSGYATVEQNINIRQDDLNINVTLGADALGLGQEIETGTFGKLTVLESSISISIANQANLKKIGARNLADILETAPGYYVDGSAGEVFSRVYARGINASASRLNGWYYNGLFEDGLPVSNVSWDLVNPDFFYRFDETVQRMEAIRGGSAAITAPNSPGGIFNFISKSSNSESAIEATIGAGLQGNGAIIGRFDINANGAIGKEGDWQYNIGGFYRYDNGARTLSYPANEGGQLKGNITKVNELGFFKFYGKILSDKNVVYPELPFTNWENPTVLDGFDVATSTTLLRKVTSDIVNGNRYISDQTATRRFDNSGLIQPQDYALGLQLEQKLGDWTVKNNIKVSTKKLTWNTTVLSTNLPVSGSTLESFLPYYATGYGVSGQTAISAFDNGTVDWQVLGTNDILATVALETDLADNFSSNLVGTSTLPRNEVMVYHTKQIATEISEIMDEFSLSREIGKHNFVIGGFYANSNVKFSQDADGIITTVEDNPRILTATLNANNGSKVDLMTEDGLTRLGGFDYIHAEAQQRILSWFIADTWKVSDFLNIEAGVRLESIQISGEKDGYSNTYNLGGLDGDELTGWDNAVSVGNGVTYLFDDVYNYASFSLGANFKVSDNLALFARGTYGNKAPELTYYFNNFINIEPTTAELQQILQIEGGLKFNNGKFTAFLTAFSSNLNNINLITSVNSPTLGSYNLSPLFNSTSTAGLELEGNWNLNRIFNIRFSSTYQNAIASEWQAWNFKNLDDIDDDEVVDYSGNVLPNVPNIMARVSPNFSLANGRLNVFVTYSYIGKQWANFANGFKLPAFSRLDGGVLFNATDNLTLGLSVINALNTSNPMAFSYFSKTLTPNPENATAAYVAANPNDVFYARPTLPSTVLLKVSYKF